MEGELNEYFVEEKSVYDRLLDFLVFISVFVVTVFLIFEIIGESGRISIDLDRLREIYFYINIAVFVIFLLDLVRLYKEAKNFKEFLKEDWLDILATIPFGLISAASGPTFEVLKMAKLSKIVSVSKVSKVSRISKISKEFKAAAHLKKESEEYKRKHRL